MLYIHVGKVGIPRTELAEAKEKLCEGYDDCQELVATHTELLATYKQETTYLPTQSLSDHAYLECSRGSSKKPVIGDKSTKKVGCSFRIRLCRYSGCGSIYAARISGHTGHEPGAACPYEPVPLKLRRHIRELYLEIGCTPFKILVVLQKTGESKGLSDDCMRRLTLGMVQKETRRIKNANTIIPNDDDSVLYMYQEHKDHFLYCDTTPGNMQVAIMSPRQQEVLQVCHKMIFIDACHSLNRKGDVTLAMVVRDPFGNAFPVAFCLCSGSENASKWKRFLSTVVQECDLDPENITFMMDKSSACIAAMRQLNYDYIFCIFHVMQAVGRFLRTQPSEVSGTNAEAHLKQRQIKGRLRRLIECSDEGEFDALESQFVRWLESNNLKNVKEYYLQEWSRVQDRWSKHDRGRIRDMRSHTNNLIERIFSTLKYQFLEGRRQGRRDDLIRILINEVTPYHTRRLSSKLNGLENSSAVIRNRRYNENVQRCKDEVNLVQAFGNGDQKHKALCAALRCFNTDGQMRYTCLGDLSCTCDENGEDICMHVEALAEIEPLTMSAIQAAADVIRQHVADGAACFVRTMSSENTSPMDTTVYECWPLSFYLSENFPPRPSKTQQRMPYFVNTSYQTCTCHCFTLAKICPHVIALDCSETAEDLSEKVADLERTRIKRTGEVNEAWLRQLQDVFQDNDEAEGEDTAQDENAPILNERAIRTSKWHSICKGSGQILQSLPLEGMDKFLDLASDFFREAKRLKKDVDEASQPAIATGSQPRAPAFDPRRTAFVPQRRFTSLPRPAEHTEPGDSHWIEQHQNQLHELGTLSPPPSQEEPQLEEERPVIANEGLVTSPAVQRAIQAFRQGRRATQPATSLNNQLETNEDDLQIQ